MNKTVVVILFIFYYSIFQPVWGQIKLSGTIVDKTTQQPIEYANIGFFEKGIGTVCNSSGKFELTVPDEMQNNLLIIKHLGYDDTAFSIAALKDHPAELTIKLKPSPTVLKEIIVSSSEQQDMGYPPANDEAKGFIKAHGLGQEGGTLIRNKEKVVLTSFNLKILKIPFDSLKFRLNIYAVDNKPSTKINTKDIIFKLTKADTGVISLPLANENIQVNGNFVCTIELIELYGKTAEDAAFLFSAIRDKDGIVYRKTVSLGGWEKVKHFSLCFWLTGKK